MINVGEKAPNFSLPDTDKVVHSLNDYSGEKVVVFFFPLAFSGGCTAELCSIRDNISQYEDLDAKVLAVSVDSVFALKKFKDEQGYSFTLLSDWNKETARAYGILYEEFILGMKGVAKRSAFIIDSQGIVKYSEVLENASQMPDFEAIKETLSILK